jgi:hypothetical protein
LFGAAGAKSPHEAFFYYSGDELQAVRSGPWKLHVEHDYLTVAGPTRADGKPANFENLKPESMAMSGIKGIASRHGYAVKRIERSLFHLADDPGESRNVIDQHPEVAKRLEGLAEAMRADLGDGLTKRTGNRVRPSGRE